MIDPEEPYITLANDLIKNQLNDFVGVLGQALMKELEQLEKDTENLAHVIEQHGKSRMATADQPPPDSPGRAD